jgi:hypothetical protein
MQKSDGKVSVQAEKFERRSKEGKGLCPILSGQEGGVVMCVGDMCRLHCSQQEFTPGKEDGECGFKVLSLYAGFELGRFTIKNDVEMTI